MEVRYFNSWSHEIGFRTESNMMFAVELFADSLTIGGEPALALLFDKKKDKLSPIQKVNFVHAFSQKEKLEEDLKRRLQTLLNKYYAALKLGLSNLSRDKKRFIEFKRTELILLDYFEDLAYNYEELILETSFVKLRELKKNHPDQILLEGLCRIGVANKKANPTKEAESILEFMFPRNTKRPSSIVMLQFDVFLDYIIDYGEFLKQQEDLGQPQIIMPEDIESYCKWYDETEDFFEFWVIRIIDLPPIHHLTHLELLRLKQDFQEPLAQYNESLNKWIECRSKLEKEKDELAATHVALVKSCISFNTQLSEHPLCKSLERGSTDLRVYSEIGLFTIEMEKIWTYFEENKIVRPDTVKALRTYTTNNAAYPSNIPVIGVLIKDDKSISKNTKNPINKTEILVKKKSIDLEDE